MTFPTITALMITKGDPNLVFQSYGCFDRQTYPNKKLLIVTNGWENQEFKDLTKQDRRVAVLHTDDRSKTLGELRNLSLTYATHLSLQFDDDDLCDPSRMFLQYQALGKAKATMLTEQ